MYEQWSLTLEDDSQAARRLTPSSCLINYKITIERCCLVDHCNVERNGLCCFKNYFIKYVFIRKKKYCLTHHGG